VNSDIKVTINDINSQCVDGIKENCKCNGFDVQYNTDVVEEYGVNTGKCLMCIF
jgi:tRNA G26 N,N-dimethylase Trm1